jgi:hypothetical protein
LRAEEVNGGGLNLGRRKIQTLEERDGVAGKVCSDCDVWKPLEDYSKNKGTSDGKRYICKECDKERVRKYRRENEEKYKDYNKKYHAENIEERRASNKEYRENNNEYEKERMVKWRKENTEHIQQYHRDYAIENKELIKKYTAKWISENRNLTVLYQQKRRARKKQLPNDFTVEEQKKVLEQFNDSCALTGDKQNIHFDHVIPISIGHGGTTYGNMIPLRADLNFSKHDSNIFEWFEANRQHFELSTEKFETLIDYLAEINSVTKEDYKDHVYWCHENSHHFDENGEAI